MLNTTISRATLRHEDLIPAFASAISQIASMGGDTFNTELAASYQFKNSRDLILSSTPPEDHAWWNTEMPNELLEDLITQLDHLAPDGYYFGSHMGDGSDFGFWQDSED